jgi:phosphatidylethanolamine/phosphatidyl-N-methylethanolamine N-methyltransferase
MSNHTATFYNRISFLYPLIDIFLKPQKRMLCTEINKQPFGRLLEIGVGNGSHLHLYKQHQITGIDTSSKMLEIAQRRSPDAKLLQMDGQALLFADHTFDYIVLSHVIAVVDNPEQLLAESYTVLKPNGKIFILNHFTPDNWLKYVDRSFGLISGRLHFRSVFSINDLAVIKKFDLEKEVRFGSLEYFKLLIYQKK